MHIAVVTLFPDMIRQALAHGVVGRALQGGILQVDCFDPRDQATDVHRTVDDRPYGGGPGMVLKVEPVRAALHAALALMPVGSRRVYLGADGRRFDQGIARAALQWPGLVLLAGRYEGVDQRLIDAEIDEEWSIGDYVLSGGELPALVVIDAVARLLPGTLGSAESAEQESFSDGLARLAALYAACGARRDAGSRRADRRGSCGDPALAPARGAGAHVVAQAGPARAARHECGREGFAGRIQDRAGRSRPAR